MPSCRVTSNVEIGLRSGRKQLLPFVLALHHLVDFLDADALAEIGEALDRNLARLAHDRLRGENAGISRQQPRAGTPTAAEVSRNERRLGLENIDMEPSRCLTDLISSPATVVYRDWLHTPASIDVERIVTSARVRGWRFHGRSYI